MIDSDVMHPTMLMRHLSIVVADPEGGAAGAPPPPIQGPPPKKKRPYFSRNTV